MRRCLRPVRTRRSRCEAPSIFDPVGHSFIVRGAVIAPGALTDPKGSLDAKELAGVKHDAKVLASMGVNTVRLDVSAISNSDERLAAIRRAVTAARSAHLIVILSAHGGTAEQALQFASYLAGRFHKDRGRLAAAGLRPILRRSRRRPQPLHLLVGLARRAARARARDPQRRHALAHPALDAAPLGRPAPARALPPDRPRHHLRRPLPRRPAHQAQPRQPQAPRQAVRRPAHAGEFPIIVDDLGRVGPSGRVDKQGWSDDFTAYVANWTINRGGDGAIGAAWTRYGPSALRARHGSGLSTFGGIYASRFLALTYALDHATHAPRGLRGALAYGDQGHDVRVLQQDLVDRGYLAADEVSGTYDYGTQQAVMALEGYNDLNQGGVRDGIASPVVRALAAGGDRPKPKHGGPAHVEVSLGQQVLMLVRKGGIGRSRHPRLERRRRQDARRRLQRLVEGHDELVEAVQDVAALRLVLHRRLRPAPVPDRPGLPGLARLRAHAVDRGAARVRVRDAAHARLRRVARSRGIHQPQSAKLRRPPS